MSDEARAMVEAALPEAARIDDEELREAVLDTWTSAVEELGVTDLETVQWSPPVQTALGIPDQPLIGHVRDVTQGAIRLAEVQRERRGTDLSMDVVLAGALCHDVSKLYEYDEDAPDGKTAIGDLLVHPHYGVHVCARAGLPVEVLHVVLSHSDKTGVDPATIEAEIVKRADEVAAAAIRMAVLDDLRDA